ncbi:MAG: PIN domain-containing protein [Spartobacteria bacterium]|nr:PIN domain-containing protein [Spartobacteria bacterium]
MLVLVDSSVWIDYFRSGNKSGTLDELIDNNLLVTNSLILTELIPFLRIKNQRRVIALLNTVDKIDINIDWDQIAEYQYLCLKKGINGVGIPDLILAQNAKQHFCGIYTLDKHFQKISKILKLALVG